jgi:hypothetical protein
MNPCHGNDVPEPILKFPVNCPRCALECLAEIPIAVIANALLIGKAIRLYSKCHDHYWTATFAEREQLRKSLAAVKIEALVRENRTHSYGFEVAR